MRLNSLYTKILLGFLGGLFSVVISIIMLFSFFIEDKLEDVADTELLAAFRLTSTGIHLIADDDLSGAALAESRQELQVFIDDLDVVFEGLVWLQYGNGTVFMSSGARPIPEFKATSQRQEGLLEYQEVRSPRYSHHFSYPVNFYGHSGSLEMLSREVLYSKDAVLTFFWILGAVGLTFAVIACVVVRRITVPLRSLEEGALQCASGNLDYRVDVRRGDELGRVARAFNAMADSVQNMLRMKQELMANVSHELRSPLARMRVALELSHMRMEQGKPEEAARHMEAIHAEVECLDVAIGEVLRLSRYGIEERLNRWARCDVAAMVQGILDMYALSMEQKQITLDTDIEQPLFIECLEDVLPAAIRNLVENAVKFTTPGGRIAITAKLVQGAVEFRIVNTYEALSEHQLQTIFQPFARLVGEGVPGTGLGLALVERIISVSGGTITVASTSDGLQFSIRLPQAREAA